MALIIDVITSNDARPFGRYYTDGHYSGERYCQEIAEVLCLSKVEVDLSGYNRYGQSWLEECFGGLIRKGFKLEYLRKNLIISHDSLQCVIDDAWGYIEQAASRGDK